MSHTAVIGEHVRVAGYALAGAEVHAAEDEAGVLAAWHGLGEAVACLILTPPAHAVLAQHLHERPRVVWAVLPR